VSKLRVSADDVQITAAYYQASAGEAGLRHVNRCEAVISAQRSAERGSGASGARRCGNDADGAFGADGGYRGQGH
jgi:hypothetical protein